MNIGKPAVVTDYDAQYDADTLTRAAEIKSDPERLARARICAATKLRNLKAVAGETAQESSAESSLRKGYRVPK